MTGNIIKTSVEDQYYLKIRIWDSSISYYFTLILIIFFIIPPLILPIPFNILVSIYYVLVISIAFNRYSYWSSSNQMIEFDSKKNHITMVGGESRTNINLFPLSHLQKIEFLIYDHEEEKLDQLMQTVPLENRIITIHFQFIDNFSSYFIAKHATTIYEWFELRNTIQTFLSQINKNT